MLAGCRPAPPVELPPVDPILALPAYPVPSPNGYDVLPQLKVLTNRKHEVQGTSSGGKYVPPTRAQELAAAPLQLRENREALRVLRGALKQQWLCSRPPAQTLVPPGLSETRYLATLLRWEAVLLDRQGKSGAAADNLVDVLRLSVKLPRGGDLLPRMTAWACRQIAVRELRGLIARHRLTEARLQLLARQLQSLEQQDVPLRETIAVDYRVRGEDLLQLPVGEFFDLLGSDAGREPWFMRLARWLPAGKRAKDRFVVERLPALMVWDARIAHLSTEPYYAVRDRHAKLPAEPSGADLILNPVPAIILRSEAQSRCYLRALRLMVRLELDYLEWEQYTRELDLVYGLSAAQRQDPFSGKDFRYRRVGRSYVLYSVGPDGEDNGGKGTHFFRGDGTDLVIWGERAEAQTSLQSKP
jgi:hypothetical protein